MWRLCCVFVSFFGSGSLTSTVVFMYCEVIKSRCRAVRFRKPSAFILSSSPVIADSFLWKTSHICPSQRGCFQVFVEYKETRSPAMGSMLVNYAWESRWFESTWKHVTFPSGFLFYFPQAWSDAAGFAHVNESHLGRIAPNSCNYIYWIMHTCSKSPCANV
jgi:hypothetical protein